VKKVMKITFYGGVGEIGGNKILLESQKTSLFLDFGTSMGYESDFFSDFLQPRVNTALKDRLTIGALPKINGIYRNDLFTPSNIIDLKKTEYKRVINADSHHIKPEDIITYEKYIEKNGTPKINGILVSHAHIDHTGAIGFIHNDIPLYCSEITKTLIESIDEVTPFQSNALEMNSKIIKLNGEKSTFPTSPKLGNIKTIRQCITIKDNETIKITDIKIKHIIQDHSIPGASSFIIESEGKKVLYTGDIRFHGTYPMTLEEYSDKTGKNIDVMICEGTRIDSEQILKEEDVKQSITKIIKKINGIVFVDFSWKDTSRYVTILSAARKSGRIFVINSRLAYILKKLNIYPDNDIVKIFLKRKGSCLYSPADYINTKHELGFLKNKDDKFDLTHYENGITADDIKQNPGKYVMMLSYFDLNQLFDLADKNGHILDSYFIKASCAPFSDDMELDEERFIHWLETFKIKYDLDDKKPPEGCSKPDCEKIKRRIKRAHVSGHVSSVELKQLIEQIKPKYVIPIHTQYPEMFHPLVDKIDCEVILPEYEETYEF
jgi:ribonuclease J